MPFIPSAALISSNGFSPETAGLEAVYAGGWLTTKGRAAAFIIPDEAREHCYLWPFIYISASTLTDAACHMQAAGTAGSVLRIGIRGDDGTGRPGALLTGGDLGTADTSGGGTITISLLTTAIPALTRLWVSVTQQGGAGTRGSYYNVDSTNPNDNNNPTVSDTLAASNAGSVFSGGGYGSAAGRKGWYQDGVTGALGTFTYAAANVYSGNIAPRVTLKVT